MQNARMPALLGAILLSTSLFCGALPAADLVDINTADATTLATAIKGVGEKRAQAIVAYREANGPFKSVDDLTLVQGVGEKILDASRTSLTVGTR